MPLSAIPFAGVRELSGRGPAEYQGCCMALVVSAQLLSEFVGNGAIAKLFFQVDQLRSGVFEEEFAGEKEEGGVQIHGQQAGIDADLPAVPMEA